MFYCIIFKLLNNLISIFRIYLKNFILIIFLFVNYKLIKLDIRSLWVKLVDFGLLRIIERSGNDLFLFYVCWIVFDVWDGYIIVNEYNKEGNIDF